MPKQETSLAEADTATTLPHTYGRHRSLVSGSDNTEVVTQVGQIEVSTPAVEGKK